MLYWGQCAKPNAVLAEFSSGFRPAFGMFLFLGLIEPFLGIQITNTNNNDTQKDLVPAFSCAGITSRLRAGCAALKSRILRTPYKKKQRFFSSKFRRLYLLIMGERYSRRSRFEVGFVWSGSARMTRTPLV